MNSRAAAGKGQPLCSCPIHSGCSAVVVAATAPSQKEPRATINHPMSPTLPLSTCIKGFEIFIFQNSRSASMWKASFETEGSFKSKQNNLLELLTEIFETKFGSTNCSKTGFNVPVAFWIRLIVFKSPELHV